MSGKEGTTFPSQSK